MDTGGRCVADGASSVPQHEHFQLNLQEPQTWTLMS